MKHVNVDFENYSNFRKNNEQKDGGYLTRELAATAMDLQYKWWGSNLVLLGIKEENGLFYPQFNIFD